MKIRQADYVVVLRKTFPAPILWILRKSASRLIFDFDDAIFCNTDGSPSPTRFSRFHAMMSAADRVFAGNEFLAFQARKFNSSVTVIPTAVDPSRYQVNAAKPESSVDLVWIGSSSTRKYLEAAMPWLALAAERIPNLRLKIIADFDLPGMGVRTVPVKWSTETEALELASSHIGIAPMRDDDWSRGKCALKVIQYMAAGLPVVSSDAGTNGDVLRDGTCGYVASSPQDWVGRLIQLAGNARLRAQLGSAARQRAIDDYSVTSTFVRMRKVLEELH